MESVFEESAGNRSRASSSPERSVVPAGALLTPAEAADRLGVTQRKLRRMIANRDLAVVKVGKLNRFRTCDLDAFIERNIVEAEVRRDVR